MANDKSLVRKIFSADGFHFDEIALEIFNFQYRHNTVYQNYVNAIGVFPEKVTAINQIPFLPIRFFKTHRVLVNGDSDPQLIFESSGTTGANTSRHFVTDADVYRQSFQKNFNQFYSAPSEWCIIGLLPSYLERNNSSLVYMVDELVRESGHPQSGFYLDEFAQLADVLKQLELTGQKVLLIGVTFALLDFAAAHPMSLKHTTIMETGGMKGRKREMVRDEIHDILQKSFSVDAIHSEYGMTELLSQAYSCGHGIFQTSPQMKILLRDEDDPLSIKTNITASGSRGIINVIDLANIYSCSFIATDDRGILYSNGGFEVSGRMDNSDLRGCSLMVV